MQPMARLYGRLKHGLTPWRKRKTNETLKLKIPFVAQHSTVWSEKWRGSEEWLADIEGSLIHLKTRVKRGGDFDRWDFQTRNGFSSITRALFTIEEHGAGKQLLRMKAWTRPTKSFMLAFCFFGSLAFIAAIDKTYIIAAILGVLTIAFLTEYIWDTTIALHHFRKSLAITGQHWNRVHHEPFDRETSRAFEENVLSGAEEKQSSG
jgi:hypothetical protein